MTERCPFERPLACLDLMIHRAALRLRARYELPSDEFRGLYISDAQVDALLEARSAPATLEPLGAQIDAEWPAALASLTDQERWNALVQRLALTVAEEQVLFIALAPHLDAKYPPLFAYLNDQIERSYPTWDLISRLLEWNASHPGRWMLGAKGKLRRLGLLIEIPDTVPQGFAMDNGLAAYLMGAPLDYALALDCAHVDDAGACRTEGLPRRKDLTDELDAAASNLGRPVVGLIGEEGSGRAVYARDMLSRRAAAVISVDARDLAQVDRPDLALRQLVVLAAISESAVVLKSEPVQNIAHALKNAFLFAEELSVPVVAIADETSGLKKISPGAKVIDVLHLSVSERKAVWDFFLQRQNLRADAAALWNAADLFGLSFGAIEAAVGALGADAGLERRVTAAQLAAAARAQSVGSFNSGAVRVSDRYDLKDLVLAPAVRDRINDFIAATRNRRTVYETWNMQRRLGPARGLAAMFTGASGTGKSMAASVIAKALGLDLYRIELSAIVSKYIGETEKNLDAIFHAAREANAILFFDEADALFGKRSEVKEAHDRYANIECAYLLQKMERHDGIVILTTNMPRGLDAAFSRRIQFVIDFPRPDAALRETLWAGMFPPQVPLARDVDFAFLARNFENTGGEIRNIALDAALRTAGTPGAHITMQALVKAMERQLVKQGRAPTATAFKHHFKLVQQPTVEKVGQ